MRPWVEVDCKTGRFASIRSTRERFDAGFIPEPNTGCWLWMMAVNPDGYGRFGKDGRTKNAHRAAWELYRGPIPTGMQIDHICRVRSCVNPDHLRLVSIATNVTENSLSPTAINKQKETCPRCGGGFTYHSKGRFCRPCRNATVRRKRSTPEWRERYRNYARARRNARRIANA